MATHTPTSLCMQIPTDQAHLFELDEGQLVSVSSATAIHNKIKALILYGLLRHLGLHPIGEAIPETDCRLDEGTIRRADISIFLGERSTRIYDAFPIPFAPDIAIEIISDNDRARQFRKKAERFFAAGTLEMWIFYPDTKDVEVHRGAVSSHVSQTLSSDLIPEFELDLAALYASVRR